MIKLIFGLLAIFFMIGCKKKTNEKELVPIEKFDGKHYISYDSNVRYTQSGAHILHEKYSSHTFSHIILIGDSGLLLSGDFDYSKYISISSYLRVSYQADTFIYPNQLYGDFNIDNSKINIIKIFDNNSSSFIIDTIISGRISIYHDNTITNVPILKFIGTSKHNNSIKSECYLQNYYTSYKLLRKVNGNINYCDSSIELSIGKIINLSSTSKIIEFSDYYNNYKIWLDLPITIINNDISGTYIYNNGNSLRMMFRNYDTNQSITTYFSSGTVTVTKNLLNYKVNFSLVSSSNEILSGNWDGGLD